MNKAPSPALFVAFLLTAWLPAGTAQAASPMPKYLRDLDRPYHAGDWTLQCNSTRLCQIIGVVKPPRSGQGLRAVVMIRRGIARDAKPSVRFAFIDPLGFPVVTEPAAIWRLYSRGFVKMPPPLQLDLGPIESDGAFRVAPVQAARILAALQSWPGSVIRERGRVIARMPRGDLARLLRKMDRLQHPAKPRMSAAEEADWLKEYHYVVQRSAPSDAPVPETVILSCDARTYVNDLHGVRYGADTYLWTASCPEGTKVFLQQSGQDPVKFDVRDREGKIHPNSSAVINQGSLLELNLPRGGNALCGRFVKVGYSGPGFVMIEDRRYDRCRMVPPQFWPLVWYPTSWRYADTPPSNGGNAPPANEGVSKP